ncbi:MAG: membrane integrity-associated transporter subunit PqiC [Armatimonadetes bacterium]|nr:membrane integrity-associated transporter subunit PqiC [Armatimonadota bacterium]
MKKILQFFPIILILFLFGCVAGELITRNYYILEYFSHSEKEELIQDEPFASSVMIMDTKIPQTYSRKQIVIRHFGPKITYSDNDIWGVNLSDIIPDLIARRLNKYNIFKRAQREFYTERPDFEINTTINNIELYQSEYYKQAHLNMDFYLKKIDDDVIIVHHSVNKEEVLLDEEMDTFVQVINDLILTESDKFFVKVVNHLFKEELSKTIEEGEAEVIDSLFVEIAEDEEISSGTGLLLLPAITKTDDEPHYKIYDKYNYEVTGKIGDAIPLAEGIYSIKYGSGNSSQMMEKKNIKIVPRYKTIIEPDWGCLLVDVIDEKRNFAKVRYEIFDVESGESFGSEFPVEEEIGEQQKIWVLKTALYKVTINNEPFNTYRDFTTIYIAEGKTQRLTIVVGTDEDDNPTNMVGAGVLEEDVTLAALQKIKFNSAIHANMNVNSDNESNKDEYETTITMNLQLDNRLVYDNFPIHYTLKNLTELGTTKNPDSDFRISSDDMDLKNTLIYYFWEKLGLYARLDMNSHFFKANYYSSDKFNFIKQDVDGNIIEGQNVDEVEIKSHFFPLVLKEGLGINFRVLSLAKASLYLRAGFGMRQDINNDVFNYSHTDENNYRIYIEEESIYKEGTEISAVGNFQLPFNLNYSTNADFLFPFEKGEKNSMEWENVFNMKLFKYISLDYKIKLRNKQVDDDYIISEHTLFLRVTYILR